jgi:hypothetical protein
VGDHYEHNLDVVENNLLDLIVVEVDNTAADLQDKISFDFVNGDHNLVDHKYRLLGHDHLIERN